MFSLIRLDLGYVKVTELFMGSGEGVPEGSCILGETVRKFLSCDSPSESSVLDWVTGCILISALLL